MKIPKSSFSEYFKRSVVFLIKTKLAVFLTSIIEFVDLCTNVVDLTYQILFYGKEYNYKDSNLSKIFLAASPYQYFFNFISSDKTTSFFYSEYFIPNYIRSSIHMVPYLFLLNKEWRFR